MTQKDVKKTEVADIQQLPQMLIFSHKCPRKEKIFNRWPSRGGEIQNFLDNLRLLSRKLIIFRLHLTTIVHSPQTARERFFIVIYAAWDAVSDLS